LSGCEISALLPTGKSEAPIFVELPNPAFARHFSAAALRRRHRRSELVSVAQLPKEFSTRESDHIMWWICIYLFLLLMIRLSRDTNLLQRPAIKWRIVIASPEQKTCAILHQYAA